MESLGNILLEKEILLESGTNEVEILVFRVGAYTLGINVAKVREVLPAQKVTKLPMAHPSVIGCFTLRDHVVPCVSLYQHLGQVSTIDAEDTKVVLTEFNQYQTAFVVDAVERIHRISWQKVLAAPSIVTSNNTPVTAVTEIEGRLVSMLDFEMIADQVSDKSHRPAVIPNPQELPRHELRILLADDSATVRQAVSETLSNSGYTNLTTFENGEEAWNWIQERFRETGDVSQFADLLISDVEMPRIDGLHLTKNIKSHPELKKLCVVLYSSILTPENEKKGRAVHADGMFTKPQLETVAEWADELIAKRMAQATHEAPETPTDQSITDDLESEPSDSNCATTEDEQNGPGTSEQTSNTPEPKAASNEDAALDTIETSDAAAGDVTDDLNQTQTNAEQGNEPHISDDATTTDNNTSVVDSTCTQSSARPAIWITFRNELTDRVDQLTDLCQQVDVKDPTDELINEAFRVLHSIKSAAMVVPVDEITQLTHIAEDMMSIARDTDQWPHGEFDKYVGWLRELSNPTYDQSEVDAVLANGLGLQKEIGNGNRS